MPAAMTALATSARVHLVREWTLAFVAGEMVGFVPPAVVGASLGALHAPDAVMVIGLTLAGALEGAALGWAQRRVLARHVPQLDGRAWLVGTASAAAFAWFTGMGGGALVGAVGSPWLALLVVPAWTVALLAMGWAQWRVLRRVVPRCGRWVPVNAGAWLVGVLIPVAALSLAPDGWPAVARALVGIGAAVAMGATVGGLTGRTLRRLLAADRVEMR